MKTRLAGEASCVLQYRKVVEAPWCIRRPDTAQHLRPPKNLSMCSPTVRYRGTLVAFDSTTTVWGIDNTAVENRCSSTSVIDCAGRYAIRGGKEFAEDDIASIESSCVIQNRVMQSCMETQHRKAKLVYRENQGGRDEIDEN